MNLDVTPLILTFNESANIARTLGQLAWAKRIVIVDGLSTDDTLSLARKFPQVEIVQRAFDSIANQCNFGLTQIQTPWVLSLDADYVVSDELNREVAALKPGGDISGFFVTFIYCINARPLRASLYPSRLVLYRKDQARYHDQGHGHRV